LDTHNLSSAIQWYDLNFLKKDLENILTLNKNEYNLVSCPVSNLEIINRFFENIDLKTFSNMSPSNYNITNNGNYHCSKKQIFKSIKDYFLK
jgi:hypothetical protein